MCIPDYLIKSQANSRSKQARGFPYWGDKGKGLASRGEGLGFATLVHSLGHGDVESRQVSPDNESDYSAFGSWHTRSLFQPYRARSNLDRGLDRGLFPGSVAVTLPSQCSDFAIVNHIQKLHFSQSDE